MSKSQVTGFDFTIPLNDTWPDHNVVETHLRKWCKKYAFQKEKGDTGYIHWQGRVSLIKKRRLGELKKAGFLQPGGWPTVTSATTYQNGDNFYVLKEDTKLDGPWIDTDYEEPPVLTRQLKTFKKQEMYPWQSQVMEMAKELDDRSINLIYDTIGNSGKSIMCEYLEYHKLAYEIPPMRSMEDIMACCMCLKSQKCYLIDMPRGMKKDKLGEFYAGLESLKNGVCYDKRYSFKKRRMDRPQIIVFTNTLPKWDLMSTDRWELYTMQPDKKLYRDVRK